MEKFYIWYSFKKWD